MNGINYNMSNILCFNTKDYKLSSYLYTTILLRVTPLTLNECCSRTSFLFHIPTANIAISDNFFSAHKDFVLSQQAVSILFREHSHAVKCSQSLTGA